MARAAAGWTVVVALGASAACSASCKGSPAAPPTPQAGADAANAAQITHYGDEWAIPVVRAELVADMNVRVEAALKGKVITVLPAGLTVGKIARRESWYLVEYVSGPSRALMSGWVSDYGFAARAKNANVVIVEDDACTCWKQNVPIDRNCDDVDYRKDCERSFPNDCKSWFACMTGELAPACTSSERLAPASKAEGEDGGPSAGGVCVPLVPIDDGDPDSWPHDGATEDGATPYTAPSNDP